MANFWPNLAENASIDTCFSPVVPLADMAIVASSLIDFLIPLIVQNIGAFDARVFRVLRVFRAIRALRALRVLRTIRYLYSHVL